MLEGLSKQFILGAHIPLTIRILSYPNRHRGYAHKPSLKFGARVTTGFLGHSNAWTLERLTWRKRSGRVRRAIRCLAGAVLRYKS